MVPWNYERSRHWIGERKGLFERPRRKEKFGWASCYGVGEFRGGNLQKDWMTTQRRKTIFIGGRKTFSLDGPSSGLIFPGRSAVGVCC